MVLGFTARVLGRIAKGLYAERIATPILARTEMMTRHFVRPVDCDFFFHMNNASYFRHAELARWELLPRLGMLQIGWQQNWIFLAVDQQASYLHPLPPLTKFDICTTAAFDDTGKYLDFTHEFVSDGKTVCTVRIRTIVKVGGNGPLSGKTVKLKDLPEFFA